MEDEQGEVLGHVGLGGPRKLDNLAHMPGMVAEGLEDAQAHGFAEQFEKGGDVFELGQGEGRGVASLTHEYIVIYSTSMNAMPASFSTKPSAGAAVPREPGACVPGRIQPAALQALLQQGAQCRLLDVRTDAEFDAVHVPGSVSQPLDRLDVGAWQADSAPGPLYVFCQAGGRATRAAELLSRAGVSCAVVEGGVDAWGAAGLPLERGTSRVLPLMRQVQIVIGLVSGAGAALSVWKHPLFGLIPLFMGAGLVFAGVTGTCGLALLMARMPWNRRVAADPCAKPAGSKAPAGGSCCG